MMGLARVANRARRLWLHLPTNWSWQIHWEHLFDRLHRALHGPDHPPPRARPETQWKSRTDRQTPPALQRPATRIHYPAPITRTGKGHLADRG